MTDTIELEISLNRTAEAGCYAALPAAIEYLRPAADFGLEIGHPLGQQLAAQIAAWQDALAAGAATTEGH